MTPTVTRHATLVTLLAVTATASAQDGLPYDIYKPIDRSSDNWAETAFSGADVNGDGCDDFLLIDPYYKNELDEYVGRWRMYSGKNRAVLWITDGIIFSNPSDMLGMCAAFIGDVDGDQVSDLVVGNPASVGPSWRINGYVCLLSGATGAVLEAWMGESEQEWLGYDVAGAGDMNGDGVPDFAYVKNRRLDGSVEVRSGADFSILQTIPVYRPRRIRCAGDLNGDRRDDLIVSSYRYPPEVLTDSVHVYSGNPAEGVLLTISQPPDLQSGTFGWHIAAGADLTGDGVPDFALTGVHGDSVYVYSGATGRLVGEIHDEDDNRGDWFGMGLSFCDINGDGRTEVLVGSLDAIQVYDDTGNEIFHLDLTLETYNFHKTYGNNYAVGDLNGDGCDDFTCGRRLWYQDPKEVYVTAWGGGPLVLSTQCRTRIRYQDVCTFDVYGDTPGRLVYLYGSQTGSGCNFIDHLGMCMDLDSPMRFRGAAVTDADRWAHIEVSHSKRFGLGYHWLQAVDPNHPKPGPIKSNVWRVHVEY